MRTTNQGRVPELIARLLCRIGDCLESLGRALYDRFAEKVDEA